jgi:hypothetical protein
MQKTYRQQQQKQQQQQHQHHRRPHSAGGIDVKPIRRPLTNQGALRTQAPSKYRDEIAQRKRETLVASIADYHKIICTLRKQLGLRPVAMVLPASSSLDCLKSVREQLKQRHRKLRTRVFRLRDEQAARKEEEEALMAAVSPTRITSSSSSKPGSAKLEALATRKRIRSRTTSRSIDAGFANYPKDMQAAIEINNKLEEMERALSVASSRKAGSNNKMMYS